jgi:hypothetical protein
VRFDDLRLQNPFHLKDFQSTFSTIDPGIISGINVYAGGFPVSFGDRMSSVIDIEPVPPGEPAYRELSLSVFHASVLAAGNYDDGAGDWLISARRGNLTYRPPQCGHGHLSYADIHGRIRQRLSDSLTVGQCAGFDDLWFSNADQEEQAMPSIAMHYCARLCHPRPWRELLLIACSELEANAAARPEGIGEP